MLSIFKHWLTKKNKHTHKQTWSPNKIFLSLIQPTDQETVQLHFLHITYPLSFYCSLALFILLCNFQHSSSVSSYSLLSYLNKTFERRVGVLLREQLQLVNSLWVIAFKLLKWLASLQKKLLISFYHDTGIQQLAVSGRLKINRFRSAEDSKWALQVNGPK